MARGATSLAPNSLAMLAAAKNKGPVEGYQEKRLRLAADKERQDREAADARRARQAEAAAIAAASRGPRTDKEARAESIAYARSQEGREIAARCLRECAIQQGIDLESEVYKKRLEGVLNGTIQTYYIPPETTAGNGKSGKNSGSGRRTSGPAATAPRSRRNNGRRVESEDEDDAVYPGHRGGDEFQGEDLPADKLDHVAAGAVADDEDGSDSGEDQDNLERDDSQGRYYARRSNPRSPTPGAEDRVAPRDEPRQRDLVVRG